MLGDSSNGAKTEVVNSMAHSAKLLIHTMILCIACAEDSSLTDTKVL